MHRRSRAQVLTLTSLSLAVAVAAACGGPAEQLVTAPPASIPAVPATVPAVAIAAPPVAAPARPLPYPDNHAGTTVDTLFGVKVADPYRWLENAADPAVQAWMAAQDQLARGWLAARPARDRLARRFKEILYFESIDAPLKRGNRRFYVRRHADKDRPIYYWRDGDKGAEHVLLDPNEMSARLGPTTIKGYQPSWDGKYIAYEVSANNSDEAVLHVMEVASRKEDPRDQIAGAKYAEASWNPKGDGFYYSWVTTDPKVAATDRTGTMELRFHKLGNESDKDPVIHAAIGNPSRYLVGWVSRDGHWLFADDEGDAGDNVFVRDLQKGAGSPWQPLSPGIEAHFTVIAYRDKFYIETDDGAPHGRVFRVLPGHLDRKSWVELVPEDKEAVIHDFNLVGGKIVLNWQKAVISRLEVRDLDGKVVRDIPLPAPGAASGAIGTVDDDEAYFTFSTFTVPWTTYKMSVAQGHEAVWEQVKMAVDTSPYVTEQIWYPSKDGTKVPMFLVHRKDARHDGSTPYLLYGYGGFDIGMEPEFKPSLYPWLEAGGGYALANLRGGSELGEAWHRDGRRDKKQNVFDDFIAAAEYLIHEKLTSSPRLAIYGGSNGGLLIGAAVTQRPDLFGAAVCAVPLLDMVRFHLFGQAKPWTDEYGSPEEEAAFRWIYAYSPYHRVVAGTKYPALLMMSADADDRVDPLHARKMVAALQDAQAGDQPIILRIERHSGHGGAGMVAQSVEAMADMYAFLMDRLKMN